MNPPNQAPPAPSPEVFFLVGEAMVGVLLCEVWQRSKRQSPRLFHGPDDIPRLIEEFRAASPRPRLLIAQAMSGRGLDAAQACREIEPGLQVIVISGLPGPHLQRALKESPMVPDAVLSIPFSPTEIKDVTDRLLGAPRQGSVGPTIPSERIQQ